MRQQRSPFLEYERVRRVLVANVGSDRNIAVIATGVALACGLSWFADSWFNFSKWDLYWSNFVGVAFLPILLWWMRQQIAKNVQYARPVVKQDNTPRKTKALVLFLSSVIKEEHLAQSVVGQISDKLVRANIEGPWRMPIEAIAYHQDKLEKIIIIPSSGAKGSNVVSQQFVELVKRLCGSSSLEILTIGEIDAALVEGVDFEDMAKLVDALDLSYARLREGFQIADSDILIDITGGQKPATAAGAIMALAEGRRFQYVSTSDYAVRTYDVTYEVDLGHG